MTDKKIPDKFDWATEQPAGVYPAAPEGVAFFVEYGGDVFTLEQMRAFADRTHALRMEQAAYKAVPGDALDEVMRERDDAEDFINELLDEVLGADRPEWSSAYNRYDAMSDVRERITALHKPAVDKAWGRFQSAMAAPQQEAQEPVAWYVTGCGRLLDEDEAKAEARRIGGTARAMPLYTAPQADSVPEDAARLEFEMQHGSAIAAARKQGDTP